MRLQSYPVAVLKIVAFVLLGACAAREPVGGVISPPPAQADAETVLEGTLEVLIEDSAQTSRTLYFLVSGDRRVTLRFLKPPLNLTTGTRVRVRGRWEDSTLVVSALERI